MKVPPKVPVVQSACVAATNCDTPLHVSWPHRSSTEIPRGTARMRPQHPSRHSSHTIRGPTGIPTEGPSGDAQM
eukprot:9229176-Pyramimonas_sp.AAC.1